jgi:tetratricopeptide (TPR) repeat protein
MANIERCRNRYPKALGYLVEARARLLEYRNPIEMTEVLREMALVEEALGDFPAAAKHLNEAIDLATETSDRGALSRCLLTLGGLESQHGQSESGVGNAREALRIAQRSGELTEVARAHIVLGVGLAKAGRYDESLPHYTQGLEIAHLLGNLRLTAYATLNRASALLELRRYKDAGNPIKEARGSFEILEELDTLAFLRTYEGQREMGLGHWTRAVHAWEEGLEGLREHGSPADLEHVLYEIGRFCLAHGDSDRARGYLAEAREIARKLSSTTLLKEVEGILPHSKESNS